MKVSVAFFKGKGAWYSPLIRWWTNGPYSHCEVVIGEPNDGAQSLCYSADPDDGGVRSKLRILDAAEWDIVEVPGLDSDEVVSWYTARNGAKYDFLGLLGFVFRKDEYARNKYFCSEANAASLGIHEGWRFSPNDLKPIVDKLSKGN